MLFKKNLVILSKLWLIGVSLFFYGFINLYYVWVLLISIFANYLLGIGLIRGISTRRDYRKTLLVIGILLNVILLAYFKYYNFFISNINPIFHTHFRAAEILLPLGISFYTFQQISYLVGLFRNETKDVVFLDYFLFVSFFPKLINGPIAYYQEVAPQLKDESFGKLNYDNLSKGLYIFFIGLFKKVVIADTLSIFASKGFDSSTILTLAEGWITSLSYTFEIYFDFSGYTDMAIGIAWMLNISLPFNFNSPYRAGNIREFWNRWHMTMTRFLRDYIYIPLGGSRQGEFKTIRNLLITFIVCGIWHGAGWTFIIWGCLHGLALSFYRTWKKFDLTLPPSISWLITFCFINFAWVFFRAKEWKDAAKVVKAMFGFTTIVGFPIYADMGKLDIAFSLIISLTAIVITSLTKNTNYYGYRFVPSRRKMYNLIFLIMMCMLLLNSIIPKGFIYNDF